MNRDQLILASASASRATLLANAGIMAKAIPAHIDEDAIKDDGLLKGMSPKAIALKLAQEKAFHISRQHEGYVIGGDQILQIDKDLISKSTTMVEAKALLQRLSNQTHYLHAGIAITKGPDLIWSHVETAQMQVRRLSDEFIDAYLESEGTKLLSSVGCYQLEGAGVHLFDKIDGDYFTVLGLPLLALLRSLRQLELMPL